MPYNTRRKSLSLPSLGIHVPMTQAARAALAAASKASSRQSTSTSGALPTSSSRSESTDSHPSKRQKRSHSDEAVIEQTPPPSPLAESIEDTTDSDKPTVIDFHAINDDIVEAVILQLQSTANRPHLVKELATVLAQRLSSVQHSANPCAIISSRLASYLKRPCWSTSAHCPLAKELEAIHPRRTYYFLTTCPRQPFPESTSIPSTCQSIVTPSVSLTDDSGSDDESRRRELSPSPEVDLSPHQFDDEVDDDLVMPATPIGSFSNSRHMLPRRISRHNSPPLEKDEREFTQTADVLQKRKFTADVPVPESTERSASFEYGYRDDMWFGDHRIFAPTTFITSPSVKPSGISNGISNVMSSMRKEDEAESWLKLSKFLEWDQGAESIEIDELDGLLDAC